jgi:DNA-binding beta-propeller fold protein YncE
MENPLSMAVSPDGRSLYVPSETEATAAILQTNPSTGRIRQASGRRGCLVGRRFSKPQGPFGVRYAASCARARGFAATTKAMTVSPDNRHVYITSAPSEPPSLGSEGDPPGLQAVAVFARRSNGTLHQPAGSAGCVANRRIDDCRVRRGLRATEITASPDGRHVYLAGSATVTVMARDPQTGALTWRSCLTTGTGRGCVRLAGGFKFPGAPAFSPDGRFGYVVAAKERGENIATVVLSLARDADTGTLTPLVAPAGCLASVQIEGCVTDRRLDEFTSRPVISPDGRDAYVATSPWSYDVPPYPDVPFATLAFRLQPDSGALTTVDAACVSRLDRGGCVRDRRVAVVTDLAMAPDGTLVYAIRGPDIVTFARNAQSGALQLVGFLRGCPDSGPCRRADAAIDEPTALVPAPDGRHVYVASSSWYQTGTVAALAVR